MTLKDYLLKIKKEEAYILYKKVVSTPKAYEKISRNAIFKEVIEAYIDDPEIILKMISIEEVHILKNLITQNISITSSGYIDYILFNNLKSNLLILEDYEKKEYYIPSDLLNCIKMAINLYNEEIYSLKDITDSVLIGILRVLNVISLDDAIVLLNKYHFVFTKKTLKDYIKTNPKFYNLIDVIRFKKIDYIVSLENFFYKEVLTLNKKDIPLKEYQTEEFISIGKYKINLFNKQVYDFLNYLEAHLNPKYINQVIEELIIYMGMDINDLEVLKVISDNIPELYEKLQQVSFSFPIWIYNGNDLLSIKENQDKK